MTFRLMLELRFVECTVEMLQDKITKKFFTDVRRLQVVSDNNIVTCHKGSNEHYFLTKYNLKGMILSNVSLGESSVPWYMVEIKLGEQSCLALSYQ